MDAFTHFLMGFFFATIFLEPFGFYIILLASLIVVSPDLDSYFGPIRKIWNSYYLMHRGATHSAVMGIPISFIVALITACFSGINIWVLWGILFGFYSLHIVMDLFTTSRIPLFYPLTKKEYRLNADRAINSFLMTSSIIIFMMTGIVAIVFNYYTNFRYFKLPVGILLSIYLLYFFYKLVTKLLVERRLKADQTYIPGIRPGSYYIHEKIETETEQLYQITKYNQYVRKSNTTTNTTNKSLILKSIVEKNTVECQLLTKAQKEAMSFRFFHKWQAMIPVINKKGNEIIVVLLLTEALSTNRCYSGTFIFDAETLKLKDKDEGFTYRINPEINP